MLGVGAQLAWPLSLGLRTLGAQLAVAVPLFGLAAGLGLSALRLFRVAGTPNAPFAAPSVLLTRGPFRLSRNPMYVAHLLLLVALAALFDGPWVLVAGALHALVLQRVIVPGEEQRLRLAFGAAWREYAERVRRWL